MDSPILEGFLSTFLYQRYNFTQHRCVAILSSAYHCGTFIYAYEAIWSFREK